MDGFDGINEIVEVVGSDGAVELVIMAIAAVIWLLVMLATTIGPFILVFTLINKARKNSRMGNMSGGTIGGNKDPNYIKPKIRKHRIKSKEAELLPAIVRKHPWYEKGILEKAIRAGIGNETGWRAVGIIDMALTGWIDTPGADNDTLQYRVIFEAISNGKKLTQYIWDMGVTSAIRPGTKTRLIHACSHCKAPLGDTDVNCIYCETPVNTKSEVFWITTDINRIAQS